MVRRVLGGGVFLLIVGLLLASRASAATPQEALALVRGHADGMLRYGTDHYGPRKTAFFTQMIDLRTLAAPAQQNYADWGEETKKWAEDQNYSHWGKFWNAKESPASGNLGRDAEFLNSLYLLTKLTGDRRYGAAADAYLRDFLRYAVSPTTGLWATGAHIDYDLVLDRVDGTRHEMERQLIPYDRIQQMDPTVIPRYCHAVIAGHFQDMARFGWNRHAYFDAVHGQVENGNFAEYGASFTHLWATAYRYTKRPQFLDWMRRMMVSYVSKGDETTARLPHCWFADRNAGQPIQGRYSGGVSQLFLKAVEVTPDPWVLWGAIANIDDSYADNPNWEGAAWSAYWQGFPWGGTTLLEAYRLTGDAKYLAWAKGMAARLEKVPRPKALMAMMVAGNMDFLTQLYLATGERAYLERALDLVPLAAQFVDKKSGLFAGAIGLDRPLYYDATQGPGYLCEALLRLYQAGTKPVNPQAYVKWRRHFPTITLEWVPDRWASSQPLHVRAKIEAPRGVVNPRLVYTRDDVIDLKRYSLPGRQLGPGRYEFVLPAQGEGFDAQVSLAVAAGNGREPLDWATSRWRQVRIFPQQTAAVPAGKRFGFASKVTVTAAQAGMLAVSRTDWNPSPTPLPDSLGMGNGDFVQVTGTAPLDRLTIAVRPASVGQMIAETVGLARLQGGRWQAVPTTVDQKTWTLTTTAAGHGLWTTVGKSRQLWDAGDPCSYYPPAAGDFLGNGRLQLIYPVNGQNGTPLALLDEQGQFTFQERDPKLKIPSMRYTGPAAVDIDGDGTVEVFTTNEDGNVWSLTREGKVRWNYVAGDGFWTPCAVGNMAGDGRWQVAAGCQDHFLYLFDADTGALLWRHQFDDQVETAPVMVDINGDGRLELLAGSAAGECLALAADGTVLWRYQAAGGANCMLGADLRGDGQVEVAITTGLGHLVLLDSEGKLLWDYAWQPADPDLAGLAQVVAADLNGDGRRELAAGSEDGKLICLSADGKLLWNVDIEGRVFACPAIADFDNDGTLDIVAGGNTRVIKAVRGDGTVLWRFVATNSVQHLLALDLNGDGLIEVFQAAPARNRLLYTPGRCRPHEVQWGMQRGDPQRTGVR